MVFKGRSGKTLTRDALQGSWGERAEVGRPDLRFHNPRHPGFTLAAASGATTVEIMHRAGHASVAAAMRYQHAIRDRDRVIADSLEDMVESSNVTSIDKRKAKSRLSRTRSNRTATRHRRLSIGNGSKHLDSAHASRVSIVCQSIRGAKTVPCKLQIEGLNRYIHRVLDSKERLNDW